jgi:hypothetical protein
LTLALAVTVSAQEKRENQKNQKLIDKIGDLGQAAVKNTKAAITRSATSYGTSSREVVARDSTIQAGAFQDYGEVPIDFSGAENLAVSITAPNSNLSGLTILIAWAGPGEYFVVTDFIKGGSSAFPSSTMGGARVPVYGSALKILVANDGPAPITIRQLAVYTFIH